MHRRSDPLPSANTAVHTDMTESEWPFSIRTSAPVSASQTFTVLSPDPDMMHRHSDPLPSASTPVHTE